MMTNNFILNADTHFFTFSSMFKNEVRIQVAKKTNSFLIWDDIYFLTICILLLSETKRMES